MRSLLRRRELAAGAAAVLIGAAALAQVLEAGDPAPATVEETGEAPAVAGPASPLPYHLTDSLSRAMVDEILADARYVCPVGAPPAP